MLRVLARVGVDRVVVAGGGGARSELDLAQEFVVRALRGRIGLERQRACVGRHRLLRRPGQDERARQPDPPAALAVVQGERRAKGVDRRRMVAQLVMAQGDAAPVAGDVGAKLRRALEAFAGYEI